MPEILAAAVEVLSASATDPSYLDLACLAAFRLQDHEGGLVTDKRMRETWEHISASVDLSTATKIMIVARL